MANSKYTYVRSFEDEEDIIVPPNIILVRIEGRDFQRFSNDHMIERPYDKNALKLMNSCAASVLKEYSDIVFAYGFNSEYSFALKKETKFYQRRSSKILSVITSFFTSLYATKWKDYFPWMELKYPPSFLSQIIACASVDVLQQYLAWRQHECYMVNLCNVCTWKLSTSGKSGSEVQQTLKGSQIQEKHELLMQQFQTNYNDFPVIFRWGSCIFLIEVEKIVKHNEKGSPVRRLRKDSTIVHSKNISRRNFWNQQPSLLAELGAFTIDVDRINQYYVRSFNLRKKLMPSTWVVIRIDGCHFHKFSEIHEFEKPNDEQALKLMSSCAEAVLQEFCDIIFAYGHSDEYSFVQKKSSQLYGRRASDIVSTIVSFFSSMYVMKWKAFFPHKVLVYPPSFDGRLVCYPSRMILHDYLRWRQVDCHINNQYNTCFWMLVKSGHGKSEAQNILKGTQTQEKMELLATQFGINYNETKEIFRLGSSVFWIQGEDDASNEDRTVVVRYCNIIEHSFWEEHSDILGEQ